MSHRNYRNLLYVLQLKQHSTHTGEAEELIIILSKLNTI